MIIRIERTGVEPLLTTESSMLSITAIVEGAIVTQTTDCHIFLNATSKTIEDKIRETIGHSPNWLDDLVGDIVDEIDNFIGGVVEAGDNTIGIIQTGVNDAIVLGQSGIVIGLATVSGQVAYRKKRAERLLKEAGDLITGAVNFLLSAIAAALETLTLVLQLAFKELLEGFTTLLRINPDDLFNLQKQLQNLFLQEKGDFVKKTVEEVK